MVACEPLFKHVSSRRVIFHCSCCFSRTSPQISLLAPYSISHFPHYLVIVHLSSLPISVLPCKGQCLSVLQWNEVHIPGSSQGDLLWSEAEQVPRISWLPVQLFEVLAWAPWEQGPGMTLLPLNTWHLAQWLAYGRSFKNIWKWMKELEQWESK